MIQEIHWKNDANILAYIGLSIGHYCVHPENSRPKPGQYLLFQSQECQARHPLSRHSRMWFNFTMTHRLRNDVPVPFILPIDPLDYYIFETPPLPLNENVKFVSVFISNCASQRRNRYIRAMLDVIQVDSYGRCFRNICIKGTIPTSPKKRYPQKYRILTQYKFVLTFENTQEWDCISEKVYPALVTGILLVYCDAPNGHKFRPVNSAINADDSRSPRDLAFYLIRLQVNS
jgi:hypothetical protein